MVYDGCFADSYSPQHSSSGGDERLIYGISCMQGWRISMEDAHATILDLQTQSDKPRKDAPEIGRAHV